MDGGRFLGGSDGREDSGRACAVQWKIRYDATGRLCQEFCVNFSS